MIKFIDKKAGNRIFIVYIFLCAFSYLIKMRNGNLSFNIMVFLLVAGQIISLTFLYSAIKKIKGNRRYFWFIIMMSIVIQFVGVSFWAAHILRFGKMIDMSIITILYASSLLVYISAVVYKIYEQKRNYVISELAYDSGIIVTVAYTLGYIFIVKPLIGMGLPAVITIALLAFPIIQIVLFIGFIGLMLSNRPVLPQRVVLFNLFGITTYTAANSIFFINFIVGTPIPGYTHLLWGIGPMLISLSSYYDSEVSLRDHDLKASTLYSVGRVISPYIALIVLFLIGMIMREELTAISIGFMVVVLLITVRQSSIMLENRSLVIQLKKLNNSLEKTVRERTRELHRKSSEFEFEAYHDPLTGLPNRRAFTVDFKEAVQDARANDSSLALLYLDLDFFKNVNDLMGHNVGDSLLITVALRIMGSLEEKHRVYRLGGDEFAVIVKGTDEDEINRTSEKIHEVFKEEVHIRDNIVNVTGSIGIAVYPHNGTTTDSLMKSADIAMYYSKEKGRGRSSYFTSSMQKITFKKMNIGNELARAFQNKEFKLHYQPQYDIGTGKIYGVEALIRWNSPSLGIVSPGDFIPIAEESGLIVELGEWTLQEACKQVDHWKKQFGARLKVGVNISPRQFLHDNFIALIERTLQDTGLEPEFLDVEITEGIAIHNEKYVNSKLKIIRKLGVTISMDDFGTGYSSLSYLKELPVDTMKIATPFVKSIVIDERDRAIVDSIIKMAKSLKINVIAEGVEDGEQLKLLELLGCSRIQGYLIGKPMPPEEFEEIFLREHGTIQDYAAVTME